MLLVSLERHHLCTGNLQLTYWGLNYKITHQDEIAGSRRSPGGGNPNPLQYSCLENLMDWGAWQATVHGAAKRQTWLSDYTTARKPIREGNVPSSVMLHTTSKTTSPPPLPQVLPNLGKFQQVAQVRLHQLFVANLHSHWSGLSCWIWYITSALSLLTGITGQWHSVANIWFSQAAYLLLHLI